MTATSSREQLGMFDSDRLNPLRAMAMTAESLRTYGQQYRHWAIAYSGGKDSTAAVSVVFHLLETGQVPAPETLTVLYADTRMELPPLHISAMRMLKELESRSPGSARVSCRVVLPPMDDRIHGLHAWARHPAPYQPVPMVYATNQGGTDAGSLGPNARSRR